MDEALTIKHTFSYKNIKDTYTVIFTADKLIIKNLSVEESIRYSKVTKIRYSTKTLRVFLSSGAKIKLPINSKEKDIINRLFTTAYQEDLLQSHSSALEPIGTSFVTFGEMSFFVKYYSYSLTDFKTTVIKRISKHFFPAIDCEDVDLNRFENFKFTLIHEGKETLLDSDSDMENANIHLKGRLNTHVSEKQDKD